jgi:hypothetical protein
VIGSAARVWRGRDSSHAVGAMSIRCDVPYHHGWPGLGCGCGGSGGLITLLSAPLAVAPESSAGPAPHSAMDRGRNTR